MIVWSLASLIIGFLVDLVVGDPHGIPHPVVLMGKLIDVLKRAFCRVFPKTPLGEKIAGGVLWAVVVVLSSLVPAFILWVCRCFSPWLRLAVESLMCWQILAMKSLRVESMRVFRTLEGGDIDQSRYAVSMIVGRDTARLDDAGVTRAAVETVAENASDGVVAPLIFLAIGGAPFGFLYKAINTMDSMLGYIELPYKNIGFIPARMDDVANFVPSRITAMFMLAAGAFLRLDVKNGWRVFCRDRFNHASPNSAQTESVCAGLLGIRLAGDAWYHGVLHKKRYIGDEVRAIEHEDIVRSNRLLYATALLALAFCCAIKLFILL